ncbi:O-antigen ligase family protein [Fusobacterium varium]|uniref:O-antigen ligase family protein n=1 Tax=Fusobacterium varium TaxID=856 RepID=UPI002FF2CD20
MIKNKFLIKIISIMTIIYIFFLIRKGNERYIIDVILAIITLFTAFRINEKNKVNKWLSFYLIGYVLLMGLSLYKTNGKNFQLFFRISFHIYILFLCFTQIKIEEKIYKNLIFIISFFSLIILFKGLEEWSANNFSLYYRVKGWSYPTIFTIEIGTYNLISFFSIFYYKNRILKFSSLIIFVFSLFILLGTNSRVTIILIPIIIIGVVLFFYGSKIRKRDIIIIMSLIFLLQISSFEKRFYRLKSLSTIENIKKETRIKIYIKGMEDFKNNNYRSLGFNFYENKKINVIKGEENPHLHNNILEILVTQGALALVFYLLLNFYLLKEMLKKLKTLVPRSQKFMLYLGITLNIFINLSGLVDSNIYFIKTNQLIFFIYALSLCKVYNENELKKIEVDKKI